jgi:hypothetical protein
MKRVIVILALGLVLLGVMSFWALDEKDSAAAEITPCVVLTGADSHVSKRSYHRITSMTEWVALWQKHKGLPQDDEYDHFHNPAGLPLIDFDAYMVIAIFQGLGVSNAGLSAETIVEQEDRILFRFDNKYYQTGGPDGGGRHVAAYGFFVIPRSLKPVVLEEAYRRFIRDPPEWKEKITLESELP